MSLQPYEVQRSKEGQAKDKLVDTSFGPGIWVFTPIEHHSFKLFASQEEADEMMLDKEFAREILFKRMGPMIPGEYRMQGAHLSEQRITVTEQEAESRNLTLRRECLRVRHAREKEELANRQNAESRMMSEAASSGGDDE